MWLNQAISLHSQKVKTKLNTLRTERQKQPQEVFCKKSCSTKFTGKHLCQSLIFNKVAGLRPATLLRKRLWCRCLPVNFAKLLRTAFLQNTSKRLLLNKAFKVK